MPERGVIVDEERAGQIRDFSKLLIGTITPTDLDMLIEYHNECFVFAETKYNGATMPSGQSKALERLCDACEAAGKPSILFITKHATPKGQQIDMGTTIVTRYRYKYRWSVCNSSQPIMLKAAVLGFIEKRRFHITDDDSSAKQINLL